VKALASYPVIKHLFKKVRVKHDDQNESCGQKDEQA
jgi:hypothetical protein